MESSLQAATREGRGDGGLDHVVDVSEVKGGTERRKEREPDSGHVLT